MWLLSWAALAFVGSLAAAWAGARVALAPLRRARSAIWVERARLAFPARATSRFALLLLPLSFAVAAELQPELLAQEHPALVGLAVALPALVATSVVRLQVERAVTERPVTMAAMLRGWVALWAVLFPHALAAGVGVAFTTDRLDARSWAALAGTAVGVLVAFAGGGVAVARLLGVARPASVRLRSAVDAASAATGVRARAVLELDLLAANAFALPAAGLLLFTPAGLAALDDGQLAAIARHELGHVSEPRRVVAARAAGAVVVVCSLVAVRPIVGQITLGDADGLGRLVAALLVVVGALLFTRLVIRPLVRRMEERADAIAHAHQTHDGEYARALEALYASNLMPAVTRVRGAHPHLYDRLVAAGATPHWPRPAPPSGGRLRAALATCMGVAVLALTAAMMTGDGVGYRPSSATSSGFTYCGVRSRTPAYPLPPVRVRFTSAKAPLPMASQIESRFTSSSSARASSST
jgi:hypothetical protein